MENHPETVGHVRDDLHELEQLADTMETSRAVASHYLRQAIARRLARFACGCVSPATQTLDERADEFTGILDGLQRCNAMGHFTVTLGRTAGEEEGTVLTRMRLSSSREVEVLNAGCLSYLGLERHPAVITAVKEALDQWGTSVTNSRAICGSCPLHVQLETELADFLGKEKTVVFPSGWIACMAAVKALAKAGDVIFLDSNAHDCLRTGARLSRARVIKFASCDPTALERELKRHRRHYTNALIVTEKIFSVDGAVMPEAAFSALSRRYGCRLIVDVAHALGFWGPGGRGLDGSDTADVIVGTFSKSLVTAGGFVATTAPLARLVASGGLVTTANISNTNAAAALAALCVLRAEPWRAEAVCTKIARARAALSAAAATVDAAAAGSGARPPFVASAGGAVVHVPVGGESDGDAAVAWRILLERGVYTQVMCWPAVAVGQAGPRLAITATMTDGDIDRLVAAVSDMWRMLPRVQALVRVRRLQGGSSQKAAQQQPARATAAEWTARAASAVRRWAKSTAAALGAHRCSARVACPVAAAEAAGVTK